jgi:hypothetical protein
LSTREHSQHAAAVQRWIKRKNFYGIAGAGPDSAAQKKARMAKTILAFLF